MSTGSARPLEDAFRIAQLDLLTWISDGYGMSQLDAYQLLSQAVESPLGNVCNGNYTAVAKVRKAWLPGAAAPATRMLASVPKPRPTSPANSQPTRHTQRYAAHRHHRSTRRPIHSPETCPTHLSHSATRAATIMVNPSSE